jgi:uncharacterized protein (TIGR02266 family)
MSNPGDEPENEVDGEQAAGERRETPRIPVEMWVEESTERELYFQRSANISVGGIFLENTIPHPKGTVVNLQFTLPGDTVPIKVRGEIVNAAASDELGMGIKFLEVEVSAERRIADFVMRVDTARKA